MNTQKHTPGPWMVIYDSLDYVYISDSNGREIASVTDVEDEIVIDDESLANAVLIAAAPEMFDFIEGELLSLREQVKKDPCMWRVLRRDIWELADLIAKAKGEEYVSELGPDGAL